MESPATAINLREWTNHDNIAEELSKEALTEIGRKLCTAIAADDLSREKWLKDNDKWLKLAQQIVEEKNDPWPGASNVKYPTLSIAAMQFHAQSFPILFNHKDIVKAKIPGGTGLPSPAGVDPEDPQAVEAFQALVQKKIFVKKRASRVSRFMSIQAMDQIDGWVDDMDRLLYVLPIIGLMFKKTYYSDVRGKPASDLCSARDVIINYQARSYERARITHRIWMDTNEMYENKASGYFLEEDLGEPVEKEVPGMRDKLQGLDAVESEDVEVDTTPYELYESHCTMDLDGDGYKEPYIVTMDKDTQRVLRIVARWHTEEDLIYRGNKIVKINAAQYFTAYRFLPDPESAVYAIGFGRLLGPSNAGVNAIINMLIDQGKMDTLGGGFLARGVRVTGGTIQRKPNTWVTVQSTGDDLRKGIVPFPTATPSPILFQLLGLLISAGKDISTVQDINMGKNPGQNQPFATTQEVISEGRKVFNGIYKRVYRSMTEEFKKLYKMNQLHLAGIDYMEVLDDPEALDPQADFSDVGLDIIPSAEPDMIQEHEKKMKAANLVGLTQAGAKLNQDEVTRRVLEAEGHEDIDVLMDVGEPPPNPEMLKIQLEGQKFEWQKVVDEITLTLETSKVKSQSLRDEANATAVMLNAITAEKKEEREAMMARIDALNKERDQITKEASDHADKLLQLLTIQSKERTEKMKSEDKRATARKSSESKS